MHYCLLDHLNVSYVLGLYWAASRVFKLINTVGT